MIRRGAPLALLLLAGCDGNVIISGIYFAPWLACVALGAALALAGTRLLQAHVFDYDERYFAFAFLPLTILFAFALWFVFARGT